MDSFSLTLSFVTVPSCSWAICFSRYEYNEMYYSWGTPRCIVLKLLYLALHAERHDRVEECKQGYKTFCCMSFLFALIIVPPKRQNSLWSPRPTGIVMRWVHVRVAKVNLHICFGKHKHFGCTRCSRL